MRIAKLFDGRNPDGDWMFAPDHPRIADQEERARIAAFLRGGKVIFAVRGSDLDRVEPDNGHVVPMSTLTDGTWIWGAALRYYVEKHGIAPQPEFLAHMAAHGYVAPEPDKQACRAALDQLRQ